MNKLSIYKERKQNRFGRRLFHNCLNDLFKLISIYQEKLKKKFESLSRSYTIYSYEGFGSGNIDTKFRAAILK